MDESKRELQALLQLNDLENCPFLIFGNKVDKRGSYNEKGLREVLGLKRTFGKNYNNKDDSIQVQQPIELFMCSIKNKMGVKDGIKWFAQFMKF